VDLAGEAIRLARQLTLATEEPEARGLLALMLLNHARLPARLDSHGRIVTLDQQHRGLWDTREIAEGVRVLQSALAMQTEERRPGRYQVEAAIAALHDDAASAEETDWPQILAWYDDLVALTDDPVHADPAAVLGRAVAVGHVLGAAAGLRETDRLREVLGERHRWHAVRGTYTSSTATCRPPARRTRRPPAGPQTSPSATTWSVRPPGRGPKSYAGMVSSVSVLRRLAYPVVTRFSRARGRRSPQRGVDRGSRAPIVRAFASKITNAGRRHNEARMSACTPCSRNSLASIQPVGPPPTMITSNMNRPFTEVEFRPSSMRMRWCSKVRKPRARRGTSR
jgi:hypothetical protein